MAVLDLAAARFIREGTAIGQTLVDKAKEQMKEDPRLASKTLVTAWVVLNGVSALCHHHEMFTQAAKVETLRQRIRFMGGELATMGYALITDVPDSQVALVVTPKKPLDS